MTRRALDTACREIPSRFAIVIFGVPLRRIFQNANCLSFMGRIMCQHMHIDYIKIYMPCPGVCWWLAGYILVNISGTLLFPVLPLPPITSPADDHSRFPGSTHSTFATPQTIFPRSVFHPLHP